jgi:hypothetical protein
LTFKHEFKQFVRNDCISQISLKKTRILAKLKKSLEFVIKFQQNL